MSSAGRSVNFINYRSHPSRWYGGGEIGVREQGAEDRSFCLITPVHPLNGSRRHPWPQNPAAVNLGLAPRRLITASGQIVPANSMIDANAVQECIENSLHRHPPPPPSPSPRPPLSFTSGSRLPFYLCVRAASSKPLKNFGCIYED